MISVLGAEMIRARSRLTVNRQKKKREEDSNQKLEGNPADDETK